MSLNMNAPRGYFPLQSMPSSQSEHDEPNTSIMRAKRCVVSGFRTSVHHFKKHVGVGIICSVAYFDPYAIHLNVEIRFWTYIQIRGNWSVDLQAGSTFGYRPMLFVIPLTGLGAILFQVSLKISCQAVLIILIGSCLQTWLRNRAWWISSIKHDKFFWLYVDFLDLASHCRLLFHDHPRHPRLVRLLFLYPLYVLAEVAIVATDLAELLGSAIGLCLIFPTLPLWAGVVLTAVDVIVFLSISNPSSSEGRPVKIFEYTIIALVRGSIYAIQIFSCHGDCKVFTVFACFIALLVKADPDWSEVFLGYLPDSRLFASDPDAIYVGRTLYSIVFLRATLTSVRSCWDFGCHCHAPCIISRVNDGYSGPRFRGTARAFDSSSYKSRNG